MTTELKIAIENVLSACYKPAKKDWDFHAVNKKPIDHVFYSLEVLKNAVKVNRKFPRYLLDCQGEHEIQFLLNTMSDLVASIHLSPEQLQWTKDTHTKITICCLKEHPRTKAQIEMKTRLDLNPGMSITLNEGKQLILARIRNMLITQNI